MNSPGVAVGCSEEAGGVADTATEVEVIEDDNEAGEKGSYQGDV